MRRRLASFAVVGAAACVFIASVVGHSSAEPERSRSRQRFGRWTQIFDGKSFEGTFNPEVSFVGVGPILKDPFHIHQYQPDGAWAIAEGQLVPAGKNCLLGLGEAGEFQLEATLSAEGLGGWLLVLGWQPEEREAFVVYNVTLVESGSPWHLDRVPDGRVTREEHREITRFAWKGVEQMQVAVLDGKLSLAVGERLLYDALELPGYAPGLLALGTYDTRYGPKPLRIRSLRLRTR